MNNKYLSKYSNGKYVSQAQYITEIICENKAVKDKTDLHYKFWTTKKWSSFFRNQIATAHKLLENYQPNAIIKALTSNEGKKIYSLRAPHLKEIIEKKVLEIENENKKLTKTYNRSTDITFKKNITNNNILSKLRNLDNES
jgi:hypothetical protein